MITIQNHHDPLTLCCLFSKNATSFYSADRWVEQLISNQAVRELIFLNGFPTYTPNSSKFPRTNDDAPTTHPFPKVEPSSTEVNDPIHTSFPIRIPPFDFLKPWRWIITLASSKLWFVGARTQFAAIETFSPIEIPFPIYKTQPELTWFPDPNKLFLKIATLYKRLTKKLWKICYHNFFLKIYIFRTNI